MQKDIHPKYYTDCQVTCACGNSFTVGSTVEKIHVELCSQCHPFYTGKQKFVDSARRVEKFQERTEKKANASAVRKGKKVKKAANAAKNAKNKVSAVKSTKNKEKKVKDSQKVEVAAKAEAQNKTEVQK